MNRIEWKNSIHYLNKKNTSIVLCMKFMVSIGRNPITSIGDEKQFPIGSKWLSIKRGNGILEAERLCSHSCKNGLTGSAT